MTRAFAVALSLLIGSSAFAQVYPSKPVRLIVADGPGGPSDLRARQLGVKLSEGLGQAVVVDNRPGGSMIIAAEAAARAASSGPSPSPRRAGSRLPLKYRLSRKPASRASKAAAGRASSCPRAHLRP